MTTKQILAPLTVKEMRTLLAPVIPLALTRPALPRESGMAYIQVRSDGKGNMAHDALIICYDGKSRTPRVVKRYVQGTS